MNTPLLTTALVDIARVMSAPIKHGVASTVPSIEVDIIYKYEYRDGHVSMFRFHESGLWSLMQIMYHDFDVYEPIRFGIIIRGEVVQRGPLTDEDIAPYL